MTDWMPVGKIVKLQVQIKSLKTVQADGRKVYTPQNGLAQVDSLFIDVDGVTAEINGEEVIDKHNARHTTSHNNGANPVSVGFTSHYNRMQERFGHHVTLGLAGENIIVETDQAFDDTNLTDDIAFRLSNGDVIILQDLYGMPPCEPFTRYCLRYEPGKGEARAVKAGLQFLSDGMRGFAGTPTNEQRIALKIGDEMLVRTS